MFEKLEEEIEVKADEYALKESTACDYGDASKHSYQGYFYGFKEGAEFGYNKANGWHYVKDGDLSKDEEYKWCVSPRGYPYIARYEELFVSWTNQENKEVMCPYAWKEIVLPELKESE